MVVSETLLGGGVSSGIWKVDAGDRVFSVKRALERPKVEADWYAPVERNGYEARWKRRPAAETESSPGTAPRAVGVSG